MDFVRSNDLSLKYQRFTSSGCKHIGIRKFEFVANTQFLYLHEKMPILFIARNIKQIQDTRRHFPNQV